MQCSLEPEASPDGKWGPLVTRKSLMRSGLAALLVAPFTASSLVAGRGQEPGGSEAESSDRAEGRGATDEEIVLGVSAAFSGPSRGLGTELYRGAMAYFNHVNENGGIEGRKVSLRLYDDGYQPDPCVQNTMRLMLEDKVFSLFGYVGTPTVTRVLPILKKFQDEKIFLFFPFTGAQPQREPPYRRVRVQPASLLQPGDGGAGRQSRADRQAANRRLLPDRRLRPERLGRRQGGTGQARRAARRRGDLQPRREVHRQHEKAGRDPARAFRRTPSSASARTPPAPRSRATPSTSGSTCRSPTCPSSAARTS